jgi:nicotinamidase-related amidase
MVREQDVLETAARQYREGDMAVPLEAAHTAILVVDMIDEFVRPAWAPFWIPDATRQAPGIRRLIDAARAHGAQIVHLAYDVAPGLHGLNFPATEFAVPIGSLAGAPDAPPDLFGRVAFWHELEPAPADVVVLKHCYSGFHQTPLDAVLRNRGIRTVAVTGTMTNYCCGATAREAFWHGYHVVMVEDLCSSDSAELHRAEIATLRRGYAKIMTSEALLAALGAGGGGRE